VFATLFFATSLTPSLIPRTHVTQGALSGLSAAVGYCIGLFFRWLWRYLELPVPRESRLTRIKAGVAACCVVVAMAFLWRTTDWQNSVLKVMHQAPVRSAYPLRVCLIAAVTFFPLVALGYGFGLVARVVASWTRRFVPRRIANVVGAGVALVLFWSVANGVMFRFALHTLDASFRKADELISPESVAPVVETKTGSKASLIPWEKLGRRGRDFISSGPNAARIRALTGKAAIEPIRVYVGLPAAETAGERARLALEELKRVGGFARAALVVITPTGTGWVDPPGIDTLECLLHGDVASVAQQYSYLSSPLSLLVEPDYGADAARALFGEVYNYWTTLPKDHRPKLYLHGLSLGAKNSERAMGLYDLLGDPIQGALLSGPPFSSTLWRSLTEGRNPDSPPWLPRFRNGSFARFMNQDGANVPSGTPWGPTRIVYLQYASDPVTFFDYPYFYRAPQWLDEPRGPDVSPDLRWHPVVTGLQLAVDAATSTHTPVGYGHVFAAPHYIDAWLEVTGLNDWAPADIERLKREFESLTLQREGVTGGLFDNRQPPGSSEVPIDRKDLSPR
jgi:uncharacterized membrane protein